MSEVEVSVVIPCLNEEKTLGQCIRAALDAMSRAHFGGEVVVADNGSTDRSVAVAQAHGARVVHASRRGYGYALSCGLRAARGKYLVTADADGSYDFAEIPKFIEALRKGADIAMGSRIKGKIHPRAMPFLNRRLGTPALTFLVNLLFKAGISDVNCGMRALTKEMFERLDLRAGGMEFASEMVIKASLMSAGIVEVPTSLLPDGRDRPPHLRPFRDGWRHLRFMLLFAPTWLFLVPGLTAVLLGSSLFTLLLLCDTRVLGIFTMFFAQGMILSGAHAVLLGVTARQFSRTGRLSLAEKPFERLLCRFTIDYGVATGGILVVLGVIGCAWAGAELLEYISRQSNLGVFNTNLTRIGLAFTTLIILGFQLIFSSFYNGLFDIEINRAPNPSDEAGA